MVKFEDAQMQAYLEELLEKETVDIDLLLAEERVKLDRAKNSNTLFMMCYISFFIFGISVPIFSNLIDTPFLIFSYLLIMLLAFYFGSDFYKKEIWESVFKIEVLNYLKSKNSREL